MQWIAFKQLFLLFTSIINYNKNNIYKFTFKAFILTFNLLHIYSCFSNYIVPYSNINCLFLLDCSFHCSQNTLSSNLAPIHFLTLFFFFSISNQFYPSFKLHCLLEILLYYCTSQSFPLMNSCVTCIQVRIWPCIVILSLIISLAP